jgi:RND family efflux transporter MFP subunit
MKKYALMLMALAVASCSAEKVEEKKEDAKAVKYITLSKGNDNLTLSFPGKVSAAKEAVITFKVSGKLQKLPATEGMQVKKGGVIAQLDQKDFNFAYAKALASFKEKQASLARADELIKNKYISQSDYDKKKEAFDVSKANLDIAKTNLDYTVLRAPFDGEVAKVYVDNFQNVQVKEQIATVQNLDYLDIKINLSERIAIQKKDVKQLIVKVKIDADKSKSYDAEITEVSTKADPATQTYEAKVRIARPKDLNVLPGMTAVVEITAIMKDQSVAATSTFRVPADAIFSDESKNTYIWKINAEKRLEKVQVVPTEFVGNDVILDKGVETGDQIVIAGVNFLREGMLVTDYKK